MSLAAHALKLAEKGFEVFPLRPDGKEPLLPAKDVDGGFYAATADPVRVAEWWRKWPEANIGLRPAADVLVLDLDSPDVLARLHAEGRELPETVTVQTGRGVHYYFRHRIEGLRPRIGLLPSVDVKTRDGYVIAPPSRHPNGGTYRWGERPANGVAEAPGWLVELLAAKPERPEEKPRATGILDEALSGLPEGQRNDGVYRYACRLRGLGVDRREAEVLVEEAARRAEPPLAMAEVRRCLDSAWRHAPGRAIELADRGPAQVTADRDRIVPIEELISIEYPPVRWLIPGLVSDGLTVLAASPKTGKSLTALSLALSVSMGGTILGEYPCEKGRVLYLDLEQPRSKTQARIRQMSDHAFHGGPRGGWSGVDFAHFWPRLDEGGLEKLDDYLAANPETRLVVIDVLAKVVSAAEGRGNVYEREYRLYSSLKRIFDEHRCAGLAIHHDRKGSEGDAVDRVSGSRALVGVADTILVMTRKRGQAGATLFATGREIEDRTLALTFDRVSLSWAVDREIAAGSTEEREAESGWSY